MNDTNERSATGMRAGAVRRGVFALVSCVGLATLTLGGCSDGRSVEAFCGVVGEHRDDYIAGMSAAAGSEDVLLGLLGAAGQIGSLKTMWIDLADVAPSEISSDVEVTRDAWNELESAALSGDFLTVFSLAVTNSVPMDNVNNYVAENCGEEYRMY